MPGQPKGKPQGKPPRNGTWLKFLLLLFIVVGLGGLLYWTGLVGFFFDRERLTRFLESLGMWSFAGFILLQVVQGSPRPSRGRKPGSSGGTFTAHTSGSC